MKHSGPGHFKSPGAAVLTTVLYTFSQGTGILLFYVKPLVKNYYYFYMSDLMNAVYNLICILVKYVLLTVEQIIVPIYCHRYIKGPAIYF